MYARYFQTLGKDLMGMTARFHKSWADFGGLKHRAALEYECFSMLASGAKCSIGDQLHPRGALEQPAYDLIGEVYRSVEEKEPWCRDAQAVAEIGVIVAQGQPPAGQPMGGLSGGWGRANDARDTDEGVMRMLLESRRTFHFLDLEADLDEYGLVILPDSIHVGPALAMKLREFARKGGALLLTGESGLDPAGSAFALKELGLKSTGPSQWTMAYVRVDPTGALAQDVEAMDHVVYERGWSVEPEQGTTVLGHVVAPYFNRDHVHFNSHAQTPPSVSPGAALPSNAGAAVTRRGRVGYAAFPLFRAYRRSGNRVYRTIISNLIDTLLPKRLVEAGLPSSAQVTLMQQPSAGGRLVAHVLSYAAERRTPQIDIIEDVVALHDVRLALRPGFKPSRVYEAPSNAPLPYDWKDGMVRLTVPRVEGHAMVVLEP